MSKPNDFYTVKKGDTLSKIAREHGTTAAELQKLNSIKNANHISVGQRIALRKEAVCGVEALFLDRDRNPIKNLSYRIEQCGKTHEGSTGENGKTRKLLTETPEDQVKIWVKRLDGTWKQVTTVVSGFGNKLVTLISGHIVVEAKTEKHPDLPPGARPDPKEKPKPKYPPGKAPPPTTDKKELGFKTTSTKTADGKPLTIVEGDIPDLDFLKYYTGERLTDGDWQSVAADLQCDVNAIRAVAKVESSGAGFDNKTNRPIILYERHVFHEKSNKQFSHKYPDISDEKPYMRIRDKKGNIILERKAEYDEITKGGKIADSNYYPDTQLPNYKRLAKALQLNREAALKSCLWGMFQIMGFNYALSGFKDIESFVKAMATSEKEQMGAFLNFIKSNKNLVKAVQEKDWFTFAIGYNGKKQQGYDKKMESAYMTFAKAKPQG